MAELRSEDQETLSMLVLTPGSFKELPGETGAKANQSWQNVELELHSGQRRLQTLDNEEVMLCRAPTDEIQQLADGLRSILKDEKNQFLYEPSEPSFELTVERTRRGGIKVEIWMDAGNGTTGFYTWDASGIRFYTTDENLAKFTDTLEQEFLQK